MRRRDFLKSTALVAAGAPLLAAEPRHARAEGDKPPRPNIIYILADDLGYGHLGCFGQKEILTPNIDKMAAEGILLTDHYAGSAVCAPSRCVLITGLHTGHCYVRGNKALPVEGNVPIPADSQTIGKVLQRAGYATACIGKWGLGYPGSEGDPIKQGFDLFFGYNCQREAHTYYPPHLWRNDKKVMLPGNAGGQRKQYSHDLLTAEALKFIRRQHEAPSTTSTGSGQAGSGQAKPFFLYLPYTIPHAKFQVPDLGPYADKSWPAVKKAIAAMITRMDGDVGKIIALLKELGAEADTLVIFTSDNGSAGGGLLEHFKGSGPLRGRKGTVYEGGLRAPFVARWPGKIKPGTTSKHICGFQDMLPTFAELARAKVPKPTDGISMAATLLGRRDQKPHEFLYWEFGNARAVRMGQWKAIRARGKMQLYNLSEDLGETTDVAAKHGDLVKKIAAIMTESHRDTPWTNWKYTGPMPDGKAPSTGSGQAKPPKKGRKKRKGRKQPESRT